MINSALKLDKDIFTSGLGQSATRDGYGDGVVEAGENDKNVTVLCADLSESTRSLKFQERFPERFFELGVAEQNMAGIAAGMALSGKIPFMSSYAAFSPGSNLDQIRVSICYSKANVKIIGAHAGLSAGPDGATHQALEDIAITRVLPNITVIVPSDYHEAKKSVVAAAKHNGPMYIRLEREKTPIFTTEETPFEIGKAQIFMTGSDITIISSGPILYEALTAAYEAMKHGISCEVINLSTIKPIDEKTVLDSVEKTRNVITVENHQIAGGLGGAICELLSEKFPVPVMRIGVRDSFGESGEYKQLAHKYGIDHEHILLGIRNFKGGK